MRTLLLELRPATLTESSMVELLRQLTQAIGGRSRLSIELSIEGERPLPPETQIALYRIAQESLNNISKHAGASQVTLTLTFLPETVRLTIQDNGRGFNPADTPHQSLGLGIMRERAQKIGAELTIHSQIGVGTTVTVQCPIAKEREGES
ncbi:MAG: ATP-binding protein [Chloroflexi bacterium]|nr:ATP-binding protein [Chloroflexota bacterium]